MRGRVNSGSVHQASPAPVRSESRSGGQARAPVVERFRKVVAPERPESRDVVSYVIDVERHELPTEKIDSGAAGAVLDAAR